MINNYPYGVNDSSGKLSGSTGIIIYDSNGRVKFQSTGSGGSAAWGTIGPGTGVGSQADLVAYLNANYYSNTNPAGYITSAALSSYLTIVAAAATYYPLTNPAGYIDSSALLPYLTITAAASTYVPLTRTITINGVTQDLSVDRTWTIPTVNVDLRELNVTVASARENDWSPAGWPNLTDIVKVINIESTTSNGILMISGLTNGAPGRIVTLKNKSTDNLIILEKNNPVSSAANRFSFNGRGGYFLFPGKSITMLHDGSSWIQFSGTENNGHQLFDDLIMGAFSTTVQAQWLPCGWAQSSGTGSLVRNNNANLPDNSFGTFAFLTGSTATGECSIKSQPRSGSESFYRTGFPFSQVCMLTRFEMAAVPTSLQDYQFIVGLNESALTGTQSVVGFNGWKCQFSTGAFWTTYASNNAGSLISEVVSSVPVNLNTLTLGVYCPTDVGDFVFFYSTDSINYQFERRFIRTTGTYGGSPHIGVRKTVGTTSVTVQFDYVAYTINKGIV